ncbi:MAG: hydroxymethylglutaryl-CoA lyase [SAR324 cluster bacterium]|nr:hydroxymethylglutaryl-CoA lyase [SAR324 cluster bacterium]
MSKTEIVTINEVGPRDGLQNQKVPVNTAGKLAMIHALVKAGVRHIEVSSFVSPRAVPQMADAAQVLEGLPAEDEMHYSVLVPNQKGYQRAKSAGAKSVAVVLSATEVMNQKNINMSLASSRTVCNSVISEAKEDGLESRGYISVAFSCPFEGPVEPGIILELAQEMLESGADEIIIADTIGAACPAEVSGLFRLLTERFGANTMENRFSAHFHDTRAMALSNVWAALQWGIRKFDSSIGGLGGCPFAPGASGNLATEDAVVMLHQCGYDTGIDIKGLMKAIEVSEKLIQHKLGGRMMPWLSSRKNI